MFLLTHTEIQARIALAFWALVITFMFFILYKELGISKDFLTNIKRFTKKSTLLILLTTFFLLPACSKNAENAPSVSTQIVEESDIKEDIETIEPDVAEDVIEYDSEAAANKILSITGTKGRNIAWADCDTTKIKYLDHYIAYSNLEFTVNFLKSDSVRSISAYIGTTKYADFGIIDQDVSAKYCTFDMSNIQPQYRARSIKFAFTMRDGKTLTKSLKMIPAYLYGNTYGTSRYNVVYNLFIADRVGMNYNINGLTEQNITAQTSYNINDILTFNSKQFGLIVKSPELKTIKINGIPTAMWVLRIREQNAFCDNKIKTRTIKVLPGAGVPSINPDLPLATKYRRIGG
jgi:hypothetical protein